MVLADLFPEREHLVDRAHLSRDHLQQVAILRRKTPPNFLADQNGPNSA
jgi:hypothetical protein